MIGMTRSFLNAKKNNRSTATTLKSCNSSMINPEITHLVTKVIEM
jgi:hypothetical protein